MNEKMPGGAGEMPITRRMLLAYALPAMPLAALGLPLYSLVPTYYTETLGLPIAAVGWTLLIVRLFDAICDPLVGYAADRIRPGFGRRRLMFLISLPVAALSALMLYWPVAESGDQRSAFYFAAWGLATKLSLAAGVGIVFPLLGFFGFEPASGSANSAASVFALAVIYAWVPIALKLAAIALMWNFPLDEAAQDALQARIRR